MLVPNIIMHHIETSSDPAFQVISVYWNALPTSNSVKWRFIRIPYTKCVKISSWWLLQEWSTPFSGDSWMYPMGHPYISRFYSGGLWVIIPNGPTRLSPAKKKHQPFLLPPSSASHLVSWHSRSSTSHFTSTGVGWNERFGQLELHKNDPNIMKPWAFLR